MNAPLAYTILLQNLTIGYGSTRVVKHLQVSIPAACATAILGFNGTGKSTLLRSIAGLQPLIGGDIVAQGRSIQSLSVQELSRQIAVVLSGRGEMVQTLLVHEVLAMGRFPYRRFLQEPTEEDHAIVQRTGERMQIMPLFNKRLYQLSDGEYQKVAIARALIQDTPVLLMDEPTSHLDLHYKLEIFSLIRELAAEGRTVIFTSHEIELSIRIAQFGLLIGQEGIWTAGEMSALVRQGAIRSWFERGNLHFDPERQRFDYTL